jgi:hypothetical protein
MRLDGIRPAAVVAALWLCATPTAFGDEPSAGAGANLHAGTSAAPARKLSAHASPAAIRQQSRAIENKSASNVLSGKLAARQRAALLQARHQTPYAARTLRHSNAEVSQSPAPSAGATTLGSVRSSALGENLSLSGTHGVALTRQPAVTVPAVSATPRRVAIRTAPGSRVVVANSAIGGPRDQALARLGGPAMGRTATGAAIDGSQLHRKF